MYVNDISCQNKSDEVLTDESLGNKTSTLSGIGLLLKILINDLHDTSYQDLLIYISFRNKHEHFLFRRSSQNGGDIVQF